MTANDLRPLPAGSVDMHDARRKRRWTVALDAFELSPVPVTSDLYARVLDLKSRDQQYPVTEVSWFDAIAFCNAASEYDGLEPCYDVAGAEVAWNTEASGYRLPTEAEWEYACRAGASGPHYGPLSDVAWTALDGVDHPQAAGNKIPNEFGMHDMLGNVWEWCWDWLDPARYGDYHVFRGGGFADPEWSVRASARRGGAPTMSHPDLGFRLTRGGFSPREVVQGWSAIADSERVASATVLPSGWTPRRPQ